MNAKIRSAISLLAVGLGLGAALTYYKLVGDRNSLLDERIEIATLPVTSIIDVSATRYIPITPADSTIYFVDKIGFHSELTWTFNHRNLAFSPRGDVLLSYNGANDYSYLMRTVDGKLLKRMPKAHAAAFSPDGKILAIVYEDIFKIWLWPFEDDEPLIYKRYDPWKDDLEFSPNGAYLYILQTNFMVGGEVQVYRVLDNTFMEKVTEARSTYIITAGEFASINHYALRSIDLSEDGDYLATGDHDGNIRIWKLRDDALVARTWADSRVYLGDMEFSSDGRYLIVDESPSGGDYEDDGIRIYRFNGNTLSDVLYLPGTAFAISHDSSILIVANNRSLEFWDLHGFRLLRTTYKVVPSGEITRIEIAPDGLTIAIVSDEHDTQLWTPMGLGLSR
jgi:WD40 repeat protein